MPLLKFEGVDVDVPSINGLSFIFQEGQLIVDCNNFSGQFTLSKSTLNTIQPHCNTIIESPTQTLSTNAKRSRDEETNENLNPNLSATKTPQSDTALAASITKRSKTNFLSPDEKVSLTKAMQFLEDDQDNSDIASEDELERMLQMQEAQPHSIKKKQENLHDFFGIKDKADSVINAVKSIQTSINTTPVNSSGKKSTKQKSNSSSKKAKSATKESVKTQQATLPTETTSAFPTYTKAKIAQTGSFSLAEVSGNKPTERWGMTATLISNNRIVVYGGEGEEEDTLSDLHVYDINKNEWSRPLNCESIPRAWHDALYLENKNLMLVFGGERTVSGSPEILGDLMVLDTECFLWYPPAISGTQPTFRSGHSCSLVGNDVVVFGGSRGRSRLNNIHVLDTDKWHWKNVKVEGKPPVARTYHTSVVLNEKMIIFGGNDSKKSFSSVHVLEKKGEDVWCWFHPCTVGTCPKPRTGHSAVGIDTDNILIYGGWDPQYDAPETTELFGDAYVLNINSWEWKPVDLKGVSDVDLKRVGHVGVFCQDNLNPSLSKVLYFGGQNAQEHRINDVWECTLN